MTDEEYEKRCEPFRKAKKEFEEQEQKRREEWLKECEKKELFRPIPKHILSKDVIVHIQWKTVLQQYFGL